MYAQVFNLHAQLLKAMAHSKRLEIIHLLRDKELSVSEIGAMLDLPQANLSQHLQVLRQAEVVSSRRNGQQIYYSLSHPNFIQASDLLRQVLIAQNQNSAITADLMHTLDDLVPLVHDPVCHMRLSPKTAAYLERYQDQTYYFCASGCLKKFRKNPKKYV